MPHRRSRSRKRNPKPQPGNTGYNTNTGEPYIVRVYNAQSPNGPVTYRDYQGHPPTVVGNAQIPPYSQHRGRSRSRRSHRGGTRRRGY